MRDERLGQERSLYLWILLNSRRYDDLFILDMYHYLKKLESKLILSTLIEIFKMNGCMNSFDVWANKLIIYQIYCAMLCLKSVLYQTHKTPLKPSYLRSNCLHRVQWCVVRVFLILVYQTSIWKYCLDKISELCNECRSLLTLSWDFV